ncbi:MAG: hypothetical protein GY757_33280 [bacterium]|nr:hypothetical protein [bacterium]
MISNRFDKKKAIWLCEHCQNINEAEIEDKFAIGKIMRNPKEATEAELLLVGGEE